MSSPTAAPANTVPAQHVVASVTNELLTLQPRPLYAALTGRNEAAQMAITDLEQVIISEGDAWQPAHVTLVGAHGSNIICFPPGDEAGPKTLHAMIERAQRGELAEHARPIPGLSFVAFDVETANQHWGSLCQIGAVKIIDGVETQRASWYCKPPAGIDTFAEFNVQLHGIDAATVEHAPAASSVIDELVAFSEGLPLVAHNAQFDASALRAACVESGHPVPELLFACTLAQARASQLPVSDHKLPTLAKLFAVSLEQHHDACADAAACAGIMISLARRAHYVGSLVGFVHQTGYTLGAISPERVTPVLKDRSGAQRALQQQQLDKGGIAGAVAAAQAPAGSNQAGPSAPKQQTQRRSSAPWQSVATPDTIPTPAADADPSSPLYGHHVTLTGEFSPYDKGILWQAIAAQGGNIGKNVTKKTTLLVLGEWKNMTSKEKRARQLQEEGQDIAFWSAQELLNALGLDEAPPF